MTADAKARPCPSCGAEAGRPCHSSSGAWAEPHKARRDAAATHAALDDAALPPTAVSLFAGVGGIDLALERAGFRVTSAVEIDSAARGVLADRFPTTTLHTDVTEVTADDLRRDGFDPRAGLVAAGFPCQDLSIAGRRKGMGDGTRSGLYWHVVRLVADLRPRWVLLENVPGLLSAVCPCPGDDRCPEDVECPGELHSVEGGACGPGRCMVEHGGAMGAVLGSLAELGYGFAYRVLDAQFFGVPQRRRRVVIVGCLGDDRRPVEVLFEPEGGAGDSAPGDQAGAEPAAGAGVGPGVAGKPGGVVPTVTAKWAKGTGGPAGDECQNLVVSPTLTTKYGHAGMDLGAHAEADALVVSTLQGGGRRGHRVDAESAAGGHLVVGALLANGGDSHVNGAQASRLVPFQKTTRPATEDHPDVWEERDVAATLSPFDLGSDSRAVELVVSATGDHTHALTAEGHDASEDGTGRGTPIVATGVDTYNGALDGDVAHTVRAGDGNKIPHVAFHLSQNPIHGDVVRALGKESRGQGVQTPAEVRRLTPRECERLQGFPDDWTITSGGSEQADSPRYQQMGNAVAVPVFEWVARRIHARRGRR